MAEEQNRQIPYSREAEMQVLGGIIVEPNIANEFCTRLTVDDFYIDNNKKIFAAIDYLFRQKEETTLIKVIEALKLKGTYEGIGENYLFEITDSVPSVLDVEAYVDVLKEKSLQRELYEVTKNISNSILKGNVNISEVISKAENDVMAVSNKQRTENLKPIAEILDSVFDVIDANRTRAKGQLIGLDTGYRQLNEFTFGFQPGELIILAARPAVGKSAFSLNIALKAAQNVGAKIAFFSLEMGLDQLSMRLLSTCSNVKLSKIRSGDMDEEEASRLLAGRAQLNELNIYLDETTTNNMEDIKIQCRKLKRENKLDFIIVDYLQLMATSKNATGRSRYEEITSLSRSLKLLARELKVPVLALSQLSRSVETRKDDAGTVGNAKPQLSDLRESGSIEQDADIVMFLHAEKVSEDVTKKATSRKIEVIIAKNRQGMTGSFPLIFRGDYSSFEEYKEKK